MPNYTNTGKAQLLEGLLKGMTAGSQAGSAGVSQAIHGQQALEQQSKDAELRTLLQGKQQEADRENLLIKEHHDSQEKSKDRSSHEDIAKFSAERQALSPERLKYKLLVEESERAKQSLGKDVAEIPLWKQAAARIPGVGSIASEIDPDIKRIKAAETAISANAGYLHSGATVTPAEQKNFKTTELPALFDSTANKQRKLGVDPTRAPATPQAPQMAPEDHDAIQWASDPANARDPRAAQIKQLHGIK